MATIYEQVCGFANSSQTFPIVLFRILECVRKPKEKGRPPCENDFFIESCKCGMPTLNLAAYKKMEDSEVNGDRSDWRKPIIDQIQKKGHLDDILGALHKGDDPIDTFVEMWYLIFLWALLSSICVHFVAALVAACTLRKHKYGRWFALLICVVGVLGPITGGAITSAFIAWTFTNTSKSIHVLHAMVAGVVQTLCILIVTFSKILATL